MELQRSDATLDDLAEAYGFHDAFHLSKAFKRATGLSPRDYRKAKRELQP
jgi:AraC-like DNA-binding protein